MLDYAQTHIFDVVTTCGRYQGRLLLILILHSVMHDITSILRVGDMPYSKMAAPCWSPEGARSGSAINGYVITMWTRDPTLRGSHIACRPAKQTSSNQRWSRFTLSAITRLEMRPPVTWPLLHSFGCYSHQFIHVACFFQQVSFLLHSASLSCCIFFLSGFIASASPCLSTVGRHQSLNHLAPDNPRM